MIQAIAAHYHLAAMHPFLAGNGRTARALEALLLQRVGLRDTTFIAMSNYYYDEKHTYLTVLAECRSRRLLNEIQRHISKELFRSLAMELFGRLDSARKRPLAQRQLEILNRLLEVDSADLNAFAKMMAPKYDGLRRGTKALIRDLNHLLSLNAIRIEGQANGPWRISVRLEWPTEITETEFFKKVKELPKAKTLPLLSFH